MNTSETNKTPTFCQEKVLKIKELIDSSTTTSIIGIPGVGTTIFLKYLASQPFGFSIYIDVFGLSSLTSTELFTTLRSTLGGNTNTKNEAEIIAECKRLLEKLLQEQNRVIIYFGGFDQLKKSFTKEFFLHLNSLRKVDQKRIVFIYGICRSIDSLIPKNLMDTDLHMLSSTVYLKPYTTEDISYLLSIYGPHTELSRDKLNEVFTISGGHFQLVQLLLRSERIHDPLHDPFINLALKNIYLYLTFQQKKILQRIVSTETYDKKDDYLNKIGMIIEENRKYRLFSPLLENYVISHTSSKLPTKEARLYSLLKKNKGKIVSKDEIFSVIWKNDMENATDWALDALIYRLRRHPAFTSQGYVIENMKKQGYVLQKNF